MLKTINSDGSLKISLIGSAVPAGAIYNGGLAYAPDGSLYVKLTQGALSGQTYNGGLACTPDGALYVANSTPAASATFRRGLLCRADGAVHVSDATVATVRHDGGVPKDNAGRLFVGIPLSGLAAAFDAALGITSSGGFASAWADQSGNGRSLLQATGANQPIHLPFAGTKYGWLPGVAGNYFSTPDSVAASITGDIDIRCKVSMAAWTATGADMIYVGKDQTASTRAYLFYHRNASGTPSLGWSADGSTITVVSATAATGFAAGSAHWLRVTLDVNNGAGGNTATFYTSEDGETWTQLGDPVVTAGVASIKDSNSVVELGSIRLGASAPLNGKIYRAQIYNGIDGTLAVDFDPSRWTSGSTFTAATGETWTINSTGSKPAQIVDRPSLLFDGAAHYMKTAPFTLNQPETIYLVAKQVSWTGGDDFVDGNAGDAMLIQQTNLGASPQLRLFAGVALGNNTDLTVGSNGVVCAVFNGASSSIQVNSNAALAGNAGTSNAGGFTVGARASGDSAFSNIQAYEVLIYNVAHDAATSANVIRALMSKHGVA